MAFYQLLVLFALYPTVSDSTGDLFSHNAVITQYASNSSVISKFGISCDVKLVTGSEENPQRRSLVLEMIIPIQTAKSILKNNSHVACSANCTGLTDSCVNKSVQVELDDHSQTKPSSMINLYLNLGQENSAKCLGPMHHFEQEFSPELKVVKENITDGPFVLAASVKCSVTLRTNIDMENTHPKGYFFFLLSGIGVLVLPVVVAVTVIAVRYRIEYNRAGQVQLPSVYMISKST